MLEQIGGNRYGIVTLAAPKHRRMDDRMNVADFVAFPCRNQATIPSNLLVSPTRVQLSFEELKCFEVVDRQFQPWGVTFRNCIAIRPSNPAFPPHSGTTVLMAAPKNGWLEATFPHWVRSVKAFVTSSQRLVVSAYNSDNQQLATVEIAEPNLAGTDSPIPPNKQLLLEAPNIYRITFCAFDGQFTVDDLSFEF
ncbi:hypothetical protein [Microseira wollei]|uniref:Uncharacterized protein n=1 Tax=Microseira wollei NIES-4236 TaxID=2530354 RepID=A0AAV3XMZ0_9CYAN|nr:hypothetical protein [Microseira wollei]GET42450.1 hypothetical protein MiSe_72670 [Microseira wollei NIES-4236]